MKQVTIALVLGTAREGRESEKVMHCMRAALAKNGGASVVCVDVRMHVVEPRTIPSWEEKLEINSKDGASGSEILTPSDIDPQSKYGAYIPSQHVLKRSREQEVEGYVVRGICQKYGPTAWRNIAAQADAFLFIIPEYNLGYPGEWKLLMDMLEDECANKVAGLVGVSSGAFGGVRALEHAKLVLLELGAFPYRHVLPFPNVGVSFGEDGELLDRKRAQKIDAYISKFIERVRAVRAL